MYVEGNQILLNDEGLQRAKTSRSKMPDAHTFEILKESIEIANTKLSMGEFTIEQLFHEDVDDVSSQTRMANSCPGVSKTYYKWWGRRLYDSSCALVRYLDR